VGFKLRDNSGNPDFSMIIQMKVPEDLGLANELARKAGIKIKDNKGDTPLDTAREHGHTNMVELFSRYGPHE